MPYKVIIIANNALQSENDTALPFLSYASYIPCISLSIIDRYLVIRVRPMTATDIASILKHCIN